MLRLQKLLKNFFTDEKVAFFIWWGNIKKYADGWIENKSVPLFCCRAIA